MTYETLKSVSAKVAFSPICNLNCIFCGGGKDRQFSSTPGLMEDYRAEHVNTGVIATDVLLYLLEAMHELGLERIRPTGGEPMLRSDWDVIVTAASQMGYKGVDITTNGVLLTSYLEKHGSLPKGLTTVKVSLDTINHKRFREITGGGRLSVVLEGIRAISNTVYTRANRVLLRSEMTPYETREFIDFCRDLGMKQIQYLDLVYYSNLPQSDKKFWQRQFVPFSEFRKVMEQIYPGVQFETTTDQFGVAFHKTVLPDGFMVTFKDSTQTMRDESCYQCPVFCQEGRCLIRIGTDGNITFCPDYKAELSHFNGVTELEQGTLTERMSEFADIVANSERRMTIELFAKKHDLILPEEI